MFDALPALLVLLAYGLPVPLCIAAYVVARNQRVRRERGEIPPTVPPSWRRFGLIGLAVCVLICVAGLEVPAATLGRAAGNTAIVVLMALAAAGAALGAAGLGERRSMWAGVLAILVASLAWLAGGAVLLLTNVSMGSPGRPLRVRGVPVLPRVRRGGRRPDDPPCEARLTDLADDTRRALARAWEGDARYEHASVPAFEHLAHDLEVARAPRALVAWARRAAEEEAGHASLCFGLASSYAGCTVGASPVPFAPPWVRRAETRSALLERLAVESLIDGCVGEAAAAVGAALGADRAQDPVVKGVLERIAREEDTHAGLAWAILDWLLGEEPRLASILAGRLERIEIDAGDTREPPLPRDLARHGRVSSAERKAHLARARELAKQMLAAGSRRVS
jgi:hypothetical protein